MTFESIAALVVMCLAAVGQPGLGVVVYNAILSRFHESIAKKIAALIALPGGILAALAIVAAAALGRPEAWLFAPTRGPAAFFAAAYLWASAAGGAAALWFVATNPRRVWRPVEEWSNHSTVVPVERRRPWDFGAVKNALLALLRPINELSEIEVVVKEVALPNLPRGFDGFRLAQLTDLHVGRAHEDDYYRRVVELTLEQRPDAIALTGDFVSRARHIYRLPRVLAGLRAPMGVFFVRGNHDFWTRPRAIRRIGERLGFQCLDNRAVTLRRGDGAISLVGVEHPYGEKIHDWTRVFASDLPACRIALVHTPDVIRHVARAGCDLAIAGHTHGGQIQFPLIGATLSPSKYGRRYACGWKRVGRTLLYTNRGLGAFFPVRFLCRPEIAVFVLRAAGTVNPPKEPSSS